MISATDICDFGYTFEQHEHGCPTGFSDPCEFKPEPTCTCESPSGYYRCRNCWMITSKEKRKC